MAGSGHEASAGPRGPADAARQRATRAFYCYRMSSRALFHLPILWVWFVEGHHIRVWVAAILLAAYSATLTFGAPVAHRLQRFLPPARSMLLGEIVKVAGLLALVLAGGNVAAVLAAQLIGGIGYSMAQGPDSVLLRSLYRDGEAAEYGRHESRSMSMVFVSVLIAGVIGGYLYSQAPAAPFAASMCANGLAAVIAVIMGRLAVASGMPGSVPAAGRPAGGAAPAPPGGASRRRPVLTAADWQWMLYYAMVRGLAIAAFVALLPMIFFVDLRVHVSMFGVVLGSFSVFAYLSGRYGAQGLKRLSDPLIPLLSAAVLAGSFALFAGAGVLAVALVGMATLGAASGVVRPLAMSRLQSIPHRSAAERGAAIATMERCYGAFNAAAVAAGGIVADLANVRDALWAYAALSGVLGALWFLAMARRWTSTPARGGRDHSGAEPDPGQQVRL
jgi:MFS family permease